MRGRNRDMTETCEGRIEGRDSYRNFGLGWERSSACWGGGGGGGALCDIPRKKKSISNEDCY